MPNAFQNAVTGAFAAVRAAAGVSVTYDRPGTGSVTLTAIPGNTGQVSDQDGFVVNQQGTRDFLILVSDLEIGGSSAFPPERADTITEGSVTYRILDDNGEPHWRYNDPTETVIRVHARRLNV